MKLKAGAAIVWTLVVAFLTLLPGKDLPEVNIVNFDKAAHLGVFGLLEWLYLLWIPKRYLHITLICVLYGGILEVLQGTFYEDRHADVWDFVFNALGCMMALGLYRATKKSK